MSRSKSLVTETGEASKPRTLLTFEEYDRLLSFMEEHPELAKGTNRGLKASLSLDLWKVLADRMKMKGFVKDAKRWAKYWSEWKYRVRRRAMENKVAKEQNNSVNIKPFTPLEERLLKLIGDQAIEEFTIKTDPLGELIDEEPGQNIFEDGNSSANQDNNEYAASRRRKSRKRRHSARDSDSEDGISLTEVKPSTSDNGGEGNSIEEKDEAATFLDLERQKLETTKQLVKAVESVATEAREIVNVLTQIKDAFLSRNPNT